MIDYVPTPIELPIVVFDELKKIGPVLDVGSDLQQLTAEILKTLNTTYAGQGFGTDFRTVAYVLFGKASKTQRATWNLCLTGCGADALALTGLLFENLVDLKYVSQAPVHRPRRFIQFEQVDKLFSVQRVLKRPRLPKGVRKDYRRIEAELSTATRGFIKKFQDKKYQRAGWSGRSIRERAKSVGQDFEYDRFYSIVCAFKHTSPASASGTMLQHDDGVDMIFGPSSIGVLDAAVHSALLYLGIAAEVQQVFGISVQPTTHAIQLKLLDAFQSVSAG